MSVNVYLTRKVEQIEGFVPGDENNVARLGKLKIFSDNGRWYLIHGGMDNPVPEVVADCVDEISCYELFPRFPSRERGVYVYESATAELENPNHGDDKLVNSVRIRTKTMEDGLELFRRIKAGTIRPKLSYDKPQGGFSHEELLAEVERLKNELQNESRRVMQLNNELTVVRCLKSRFETQVANILQLRNDLSSRSKWWTVTVNERMVLSIDDALATSD
ncbi:MAG: hypothetical protein Q8P78_00810 [bacterium]|nr:hypothetical protein [bacterium]